MRINQFLAPALILSTLTTGCATVLHGSTQMVTFNSQPEGADIFVEGNLMGKTPATFNLKKNKYKTVEIKKDGYDRASVALSTSYDTVALLNIFWDLSTTDLATGNAYEYEPNSYTVKLVKSEVPVEKKQ
jgi:hypothetical protein